MTTRRLRVPPCARRAIVDASGRGALLSRKFDLRIDEPRLANLAVFSHYSGVPRQSGRRAGDIRIVAREDLGWFWIIPISDELMSVGVVLPRSAAPRAAGPGALARCSTASIAETPAVARLLASAHREWPVRVEKDFSFGSRAYAGDRWVLAGDAGSFLDPVFSTGVAIALESGLEAAQAVAMASQPATCRRGGSAASRGVQRQRYLLVPPVRPRVLHTRVPRSLLRRRAAAPDVPRARHGLRRLLAPVAHDARLGRALLPARSACSGGCGSRPRLVATRSDVHESTTAAR